MTVGTWQEAEAVVRQLAGALPIYWGTGYAIHHPCVVAHTLDAWSGEGRGYHGRVYPDGEQRPETGTGHTVLVRGRPS